MPTRPAQQQDAGDQTAGYLMKLHVYPPATLSNGQMFPIKTWSRSKSRSYPKGRRSASCLSNAQNVFRRDRPRLVCDPSARFRPQLVVDRHASLGLSALTRVDLSKMARGAV